MSKQSILQYACIFLLAITAAVPVNALETKQAADEASMNAIATNAFRILRDVPSVGLEKSRPELNQIIETHHRLLKGDDMSQQRLSLILADGVAYAIISEIHRADLARLGSETNMTPTSIPFDKKIVVRLWDANMPDFPSAVRYALKGDGTVTGYIATHSSEADVLNGKLKDKAPLKTIRSLISELHEKALYIMYSTKKPSADEQLIYALCKYQAFRDLSIIIKLYEKNDLPDDSKALQAMIEENIKQSPQAGKRLDDGMAIIAFKVRDTFENYYPEASYQDTGGPIHEYVGKQAFPLVPFMTDRSMLPDYMKKFLDKQDRRAAANQTK